MMLIDSHAHLDFDVYANDLDGVLSRAWQTGLEHIVTIGSGQGSEGAGQAVELAERESRISATVGIHPHDADLEIQWNGDPKTDVSRVVQDAFVQRKEQVVDHIQALLKSPKVVAVGEIGLDYHYDHAPRKLQRELFEALAKLAVANRKPLVVHSREADEDTAAILRRVGCDRTGGVIHCYGGSETLLRLARDLHFYLGIAGPITYKKSEQFRRMVAEIPLEMLLVETDCPFLAPEPYRGKRNEPRHVELVVKKIAEIKSIDPMKVAEATTQNAKRLFGISS